MNENPEWHCSYYECANVVKENDWVKNEDLVI